MHENLRADPTYAVVEILHFVFVKPGDGITGSLHIPFTFNRKHPDFIKELERDFKFFRRTRKDIPEGNLAVFIYDRTKHNYYYYKTIKNRRKSFDLSSDSE